MNNIRQTTKGYIFKHKESSLKVGDIVIVTRKACRDEQGWNNIWISPEMDRYVGNTYSIEEDRLESGFIIEGWGFPYFVLSLVRWEDIGMRNKI